MTKVDIPTLKKFRASVAKDGSAIKLDFHSADGQAMTVALPANDFTTFLSKLIKIGKTAAAKSLTPSAEGREINFETIPVDEMGLAESPHDPTEVILTVRTGPFKMAFAVSVNVAYETLKQMEAGIQQGATPQTH